MPNPTPTPNSPDRNELRRKVRRLFAGRTHKHETIKVFVPKELQKYRTVIAPYEPTVEAILELVDAHMDKLQQTIEAGADEYYHAVLNMPGHYVPIEAIPLSTITKAFNTARGKE